MVSLGDFCCPLYLLTSQNLQGGKEIEQEKKQKSEGIVPLQSGTNKLASQRGMTGFGTPRNTQMKSGWKKEW